MKPGDLWNKPILWPALFLFGRMALLISFSQDALRGFGDLLHFYKMAEMGWPFLDIWVEFPPVFPFLSALLYHLAGGRQHVYEYLLVMILTLAQAGSLAVFIRLAGRIWPEGDREARILVYFLILLVLSYGWWYFDPLAVLAMLLGALWTLEGKDRRAGWILAAGFLTKWFPALVLAAAWKLRPPRRAYLVTAMVVVFAVSVYGLLYLFSPQFTQASLLSQGSKGSWETLWALIDGNLGTGNFGPLEERFDPSAARLLRGSPAVIPAHITLLAFGLLGALVFWITKVKDGRDTLSFVALTWSVFLIWSPGWSPQWVLYLLPVILLALPARQAILIAASLVLVNLLEWPVLLTRGYTQWLWAPILLRTFLFVLIAGVSFMQLPKRDRGRLFRRNEANASQAG